MANNKRALVAIMFADIFGFTALMQDDEKKANTLRQKFKKTLESLINEFDGELIQFYGDGALSVFRSGLGAVECAVGLQKLLLTEPNVLVRIGLHMGDVIHDEGGIYGDSVNIASRVESMSAPGGVLISEKLFDEIKNHKHLKTQSLGKFELKNVKLPIEIFAIVNEGIKVPDIEITDGKFNKNKLKIVVLPFLDLSYEKEIEFLCDSLTEETINKLSFINNLKVISRTSSFAYKNKNEDVKVIGTSLGVNYVIEGSIRKENDLLRITVQLIDIENGFHLFSNNYEKKYDNILRLQDEISNYIVEEVESKILSNQKPEHLSFLKSKNLKVNNLIKASDKYFKHYNPEDTNKSIFLLKEAIRISPEFSLAYSNLSWCHIILGVNGLIKREEAYKEVSFYAKSALKLNDSLAEAYAALASAELFFHWNFEDSKDLFQRALEINPESNLVNTFYAYFLLADSKITESQEFINKALTSEPDSILSLMLSANIQLILDDYKSSLNIFDKILSIKPQFANIRFLKAITYLLTGNYDISIKLFNESVINYEIQNKLFGYICLAYSKAFDIEMAKEYYNSIKQTRISSIQYSHNYQNALLYQAFEDSENEFKSIKKANEAKEIPALFLKINPFFKHFYE